MIKLPTVQPRNIRTKAGNLKKNVVKAAVKKVMAAKKEKTTISNSKNNIERVYMENYIEVEEFNDHYINQNTRDKSFVVFGKVERGYFIDLTFSKKRKILYKADNLIEMRKKIAKSGIRRSPRRH